MKQGVEGEGRPVGKIERIGAPRNRLQFGIAGQHLFRRKFARIETDGDLWLRRIQSIAERICRLYIIVLVHKSHEVLR